MASENKSKSRNVSKNNKQGKQRYLPYNKSVKKGMYPLRPGVQGFFITCDGGRERQASQEAINVIDSFYEELVHGRDSETKHPELSDKPLNKITKFTYSDSSSDDDEEEEENTQKKDEDKNKLSNDVDTDAKHESSKNEKSDPHNEDGICCENQIQRNADSSKVESKNHEDQEGEAEQSPAKKQCLETDASKCEKVICDKMEEKSVDKLIEAQLTELGDRSKRRFISLDSGCNGVIFVQMRKRDGDPNTKDIVQHMMMSVASSKKHMSRFLLRVLPVEVSCYASEEEIARAIKPLTARYFPAETQTPHKFAVLYEARSNTGIDRMKIINTVARSVPGPHKVDLNNPDMNIVVQIVKTVCLIGVVEKYKELAKYNLRQLTSSDP